MVGKLNKVMDGARRWTAPRGTDVGEGYRYTPLGQRTRNRDRDWLYRVEYESRVGRHSLTDDGTAKEFVIIIKRFKELTMRDVREYCPPRLLH
jgi:hypothetical protein